MKRNIKKESDSSGILLNLSEVVTVVFLKKTKYHEKDEEKQVSIPIAHKWEKMKKVSIKKEDKETLSDFEKKVATANEAPKM